MIKARYIGVECELQSGKVYPIKTRLSIKITHIEKEKNL